jgi:hypothetical protein
MSAGRAWSWAAFIGVLLLGACLGYREIFSPDIGFYLSTGRWIVEHGSIPDADMLTWTRAGTPWVNPQWLFWTFAWALYQAGGTLLITVTNIALTLASFGLIAVRCVRRDGRLSAVAPLLLMMFALGQLWEFRNHVASWLFLNLILLSLEEYRRGQRNALWFLPIIMVLWVNCHALFVLGLVAIGVYVLDELRKGKQADRPLLAWALAAGLACLVNPYGWNTILFPLTHFAKLQSSSLFKSDLVGTREFLSPFHLEAYSGTGQFVLLQPVLFMHLYILAAIIGAVAWVWRAPKSSWFVDGLLYLMFGYIFWKAQKNFGYFVIASFPVLIAGWETFFAPTRHRFDRLLPAGTMIASAFFLWIWATGYLYAQERNGLRIGHKFSETHLPVRAADFLHRHVPEARLLNNWDAGGYIGFATRRPVFIDGRSEVVGEQFYAEYIDLKQHKKMGSLLEKWKPQVVVVPYNDIPEWMYYLNRHRNWRMVYADDRDVIFLHATIAPDMAALAPPVPGRDDHVFAPSDADAILHAAIQRKRTPFIEVFTRRHHYPLDAVRLTALHYLRGHPYAAIHVGLTGLQRATVPCPDILNNLMQSYIAVGDTARARRCYDAIPEPWRDPRLAANLPPPP